MNRSLSLHTPHGALYGHQVWQNESSALILLMRSHHAAVDMVISENLAEHGFAVFSMDLLTTQETQFPDATQNVPKLTQRMIEVLDFARRDPDLENLPIGIFSIGDTSPAAIRAAAQRDTQIKAVACHGGSIDRAGKQSLEFLNAPLLMLCDADDLAVKGSYERSCPYLSVPHELALLNQAEDPVEQVSAWFSQYLQR